MRLGYGRAALALLLCCLGVVAQAQPKQVTLVAGGGTRADGSVATQARLTEPFAVGTDTAGNLYIVEMEGGERVRKVRRDGMISPVAGTGKQGYSGDGGKATDAQIQGAHHLLILPSDDLLIADTFNHCVRRVSATTGTITTFAGTGTKGYFGDGGLAAQAQFNGVFCLALDVKRRRLYLCDLGNRRIRSVDLKNGIVTTVAGDGRRGIPDDGAEATKSPLIDPRAITLDSKGNLYILERGGNALRVVSPEGKIRTVLGAPNQPPPAEVGAMDGPKHLCVDREDNVYIADTENHRILKFLPRSGVVQVVVGTGKPPASGVATTEDLNGSAREVTLNRPHGVFIHRDGSLYIADSSNGRILRVALRPEAKR
jgi:hypothetical protein